MLRAKSHTGRLVPGVHSLSTINCAKEHHYTVAGLWSDLCSEGCCQILMETTLLGWGSLVLGDLLKCGWSLTIISVLFWSVSTVGLSIEQDHY